MTRTLMRAVPWTSWALVGPAWLAAVAVLWINARHYYPFISDDAFISLRYAERLIEGRGLTWSAGEPVEGYSNLLWILLSALLGAVGVDLVLATRILGVAAMATALGAVAWAVAPRRLAHAAAGAVGMLAFAASGPAGAWSVGGLEQPLVAALLAAALVAGKHLLADGALERRQLIVPGALLALLTLSRADAPILVAGFCAAIVVMHRFRRVGWQRGFLVALIPLGAYLGQLAFRVFYYDSWVPNTARVKVAFTSARVQSGLEYVGQAASSSLLVIAAGAVVLAIGARTRTLEWKLAAAAWIVAAVWTAYLVLIGGDIFPAYRHWLVVLVALCLALALALRAVVDSAPRVGWGLVAVTAAAAVAFGLRQPRDPENHRAVTERWEYNGEVVGRLFHDAFDREPLLAAAAVGALCYYAKMPCLDMLGLNDRHIAENVPEDFGTGFIGHELGDGAYAMRREPDLVVFCGPTGRRDPCSRGEKEMVADPNFHELYQLVYFRGTVPFEKVGRVWVRRSGAVGIERGDGTVRVPGYLLRAPRDARAALDASQRIGLHLPAETVARVNLPLDAGRWKVRVEAEDPAAIKADVSAAGTRASGGPELEIELPHHAASARIRVRASEAVHVRAVILERAVRER